MNSSVCVIRGFDNYVDPPRDFWARRTLHRVAVVLPLMLCDDIHGLLNAFSEICGIARNALCVNKATALLEDGRVLESEDYAKLIREVSLKQTGAEESLDSLIPIRWMLYKAGVLVASLETEFWGAVGGPPPYSDSYTVSVYSEVDVTTALEQGIDSLCSKMKNKSIVTGCPALLYTLLGPPISVRQACRLRGSMLSYNMRREPVRMIG